MTVPVVLVHGTWGLNDKWWKTDSDFGIGLLRRGVRLVNGDCYRWSGALSGVFETVPGDPDDPLDKTSVGWAIASRALRWYVGSHGGGEVSIVAHSHGGQLAIMAAASGMKVRHIITMSTPVRRDMELWRKMAAVNISGHWIHIHGDWWRDRMIRLGEAFDGKWGWTLEFPEATLNIHIPGKGHSDLIDLGLFDRYDIIDTLRS